MLKIIFTLSLVLFLFTTNSQNINDIFLNLPDTSILSLSKQERGEMISNFAQLKKGIYFFEILDSKNGYARISGSMEGFVELCYWNLTDGKKLVAIYQEGCGPICYVERFDFYIVSNNQFKPCIFSNIIPEIYPDFFYGNYKTVLLDLEKKDVIANLLYVLPRSGKNIQAKIGDTDLKQYMNVIKGSRMLLQWNNGSFTKGIPFWE